MSLMLSRIINLKANTILSSTHREIVGTDSRLIEGLRKNDRSSQETFYKQYFGKMFPVALRYSSDKEDAHEIINTAFLKVIDTIHKYKDNNFGGWVRTIVKRTAIDHCRKYNYHQGTSTTPLIETDSIDQNAALSSLELEDTIRLIQNLPNATRTVFNLFVFEDYTHEEIADKLKISKGTSKWHVSNARKLLMDLVKKEIV